MILSYMFHICISRRQQTREKMGLERLLMRLSSFKHCRRHNGPKIWELNTKQTLVCFVSFPTLLGRPGNDWTWVRRKENFCILEIVLWASLLGMLKGVKFSQTCSNWQTTTLIIEFIWHVGSPLFRQWNHGSFFDAENLNFNERRREKNQS